jgi:hypothetical protein
MKKLEVNEEIPLKWPDGWERTRIDLRKSQAGWKKQFKLYRESLSKELERLGAESAVISRNGPDRERLDPGIAVYFSKELKQDFTWQSALNLNSPAPTLDEIDAAYRAMAMKHHPDRGGDVEVFRALTKHRDQARAWVLGTHQHEHQYVIACDKFNEARLNLAAIRLAIAALRQLDRVGVSSILERTFRGFRTQIAAHAGADSQGGASGSSVA